ncbi:cytochrome b [Limnohabitans sp.]|uniref:cytochrome b n=1 Tax=Limnohabitans sp. TaxID=1907725 RepID=UPI00286F6D12|nr:cytochrome b [Limnohabitans sp.]
MEQALELTPDDAQTPAPPSRYTRVAIALHWLLAFGLIYQIWLGVWMGDIPKTPPGLRAEWFNWHKSMGIVLGLVIVLRGLWRLTHQPPELPQSLPRWQAWAAHLNHALLYGCMIGMPVSGFLGSSFTAYPIKFFGTPLPRLWEASAELKEFFSGIHTACSYVFMALIATHIVAALWHALRRDGVVARMHP